MENCYDDEEEHGRRTSYLILHPRRATFANLLRFLLSSATVTISRSPRRHLHVDLGFIDYYHSSTTTNISINGDHEKEEVERFGPVTDDHRLVIVVSVLARKIVMAVGKPMKWAGMVLEFFLNLLTLNCGLINIFIKAFKGTLVIPRRGSDTYISAIGHLDPRTDLYKDASSDIPEIKKEICEGIKTRSKALLDLCIMAAKLAYENENVVRNTVVHQWKMHFLEFYNCWNEYQNEMSTQVFILCDKPKDANLILISFRGTEPFDADDWSTDFDCSWYEIPELGRVHMGFLEALGLGTRTEVPTFTKNLQPGADPSENRSSMRTRTNLDSSNKEEMSAYYVVRARLKSLIEENKKAKFIVTGHSLGGALAILFPAVLLLHKEKELMMRLQGVYTFGQPRVGDVKLGKFMKLHLCGSEPKFFRVVYCNDVVPRLPYDDKTFLFKHFGACLYYDSFYNQKDMNEAPNRNYFVLRYLLPIYVNAIWELMRSIAMGCMHGAEYRESWCSIILRVYGLAMPGISAHSPINYVNSIRLGRQEDKTGTSSSMFEN